MHLENQVYEQIFGQESDAPCNTGGRCKFAAQIVFSVDPA